jgi:hypothetical protein
MRRFLRQHDQRACSRHRVLVLLQLRDILRRVLIGQT